MEITIVIFLGIGIAIIALALILSRIFARTIERDRRNPDTSPDINADPSDGRGTATWIGVNKASDKDFLD